MRSRSSARTKSSSIASGRASTCRSGSASIAALGNRLAELQLRILWEEMLRRDLQIEVVDKPVYAYSNFLHAIRSLPVRIAA